MKMVGLSILCVLSVLLSLVLCESLPYDIVDLSRDHGGQSVHHPLLTGYKKKVELTGTSQFGIWIYSNIISSTEHIGTHMDAPTHFNEHGWHMHQVPMSHLIGPGVIINVKDKVRNNPDYRVSVTDVQDWEKKYGRIPDGAIIIMNSGWEKNYPDLTKVFGTNTPNVSSTFHFPGFHEDTVQWIINNRKMHIIGSDTPAFDYGQTKTHPVHIMTSKENICGLENVANLDKIPPSGTYISAAPVKIIAGSGFPVRLYAMIPRSDAGNFANNGLLVVLTVFLITVCQFF